MKRKFALILAAVILLTAASGCSDSADNAEATTTGAGETTSVSTVEGTPTPEDIKTVVAYVEGQDDPSMNITFDQWNREYRFYLLRYGIDETNANFADDCKKLRQDILQMLQIDRMVLKEAELAGVGINSLTAEEREEIDNTLQEAYKSWCNSFAEEAKEALGENYTDEELYNKEYELFTEFLAQAGATTELFMMWERNNKIQEKLYEHIAKTSGITDEDVEAYLNDTIAKAKDAYENDLAEYEEKYTAFYIPENTRVVEQIYFKLSSDAINEIAAYRKDGDDATADALLAKAVKEELQAEIDAAVEALAKGEKWDDVQVIYNDDANGNDAVYVVYPKSTSVIADVTEKAMAMTGVGGVSDVITTDGGCYLLYYLKDAVISDEDMEKMRSQCRDYLESQFTQEVVEGWQEKYPYAVEYELLKIDEPTEEVTTTE